MWRDVEENVLVLRFYDHVSHVWCEQMDTGCQGG